MNETHENCCSWKETHSIIWSIVIKWILRLDCSEHFKAEQVVKEDKEFDQSRQFWVWKKCLTKIKVITSRIVQYLSYLLKIGKSNFSKESVYITIHFFLLKINWLWDKHKISSEIFIKP